jgi:hypothetical protein
MSKISALALMVILVIVSQFPSEAVTFRPPSDRAPKTSRGAASR